MYLLILVKGITISLSSLFTSHYVSINSNQFLSSLTFGSHLHPTMYLLIREAHIYNRQGLDYLHPTMYLLIHPKTKT